MLRKTLLLIIVTSALASTSCGFLTCVYHCLERVPMPQSNHEIGERLSDPLGSLWEYQGNFPVVLGQITADLRLLTVFIFNTETWVMDTHKEIVPDSVLGDVFILIKPGDELMADIVSKNLFYAIAERKIFNVVIPDVLEAKAVSTPGSLSCLMLLLNQ